MTTQQAIDLQRIAAEHDIDVGSYADYSGRGMFGERTQAITLGSRRSIDRLSGLYEAKHGTPLELRIDNLGRDYIAY